MKNEKKTAEKQAETVTISRAEYEELKLQKPLGLELQRSQLCLLRFIFRARNSHHFGSI